MPRKNIGSALDAILEGAHPPASPLREAPAEPAPIAAAATNPPPPAAVRSRRAPTPPKLQPAPPSSGKPVRLTVDLPADLVERARALVYWSPDLTLSGVIRDGLAAHLEELEQNRGAAPQERGRLKTRRPRLR